MREREPTAVPGRLSAALRATSASRTRRGATAAPSVVQASAGVVTTSFRQAAGRLA